MARPKALATPSVSGNSVGPTSCCKGEQVRPTLRPVAQACLFALSLGHLFFGLLVRLLVSTASSSSTVQYSVVLPFPSSQLSSAQLFSLLIEYVP